MKTEKKKGTHGGKRKGAGRPEGSTTAPESKVVAVRLAVSLIEQIEQKEGMPIGEFLKWVCLEHQEVYKKKNLPPTPSKKPTKPSKKPTDKRQNTLPGISGRKSISKNKK